MGHNVSCQRLAVRVVGLMWRRIPVYPVVEETKCLGYHISCNGNVGRSKATLFGGLRGCLARLSSKYSNATAYVKAKWWKTQFRGFIGFYAAFLGLNPQLFDQLSSLGNAGARKVANMHPLNNSSVLLQNIRDSTTFVYSVSSFKLLLLG